MQQSTVFTNNRTQAVRLPSEMRFPKDVKKVTIRAVGKERIIAPIENTWESFFTEKNQVSADFLPERATQEQNEREAF